MALTKRIPKGAPLSYAEHDANVDHFDLKTKDGWADIVSEFYTRGGPASPGVSQFTGGIYLLEFSDTDTLEAFANFHVPHSYKPGTGIYPHIHFSVQGNNAGTVRWGCEYTFARRHDSTGQIAFPATSTIYIDFAVPANSAYKHFVAEAVTPISGTNVEVDGMFMCRFFREPTHANDTFAGSVWAITADLHIEVDRAATPSRSPDFYTG